MLVITIALEKVLSQLGQGVVQIPFGDIRAAAPHVFAPGIESDRVPVALPLGEILSRINPALLVRRTAQRQIEVPDEISSPFDDSRTKASAFGGERAAGDPGCTAQTRARPYKAGARLLSPAPLRHRPPSAGGGDSVFLLEAAAAHAPAARPPAAAPQSARDPPSSRRPHAHRAAGRCIAPSHAAPCRAAASRYNQRADLSPRPQQRGPPHHSGHHHFLECALGKLA